jgi:site-specific DNA-methyltransferase (adenine-specific)
MGAMISMVNDDFRNYTLTDGLVITDPPYNQNYHYSTYNDNLLENDYIELLSKIPTPCVIIHYPEETVNILPKAINAKCEQIVTWVYNSNTGKQSRSISWWGCKPDFSKIRQPYKNINDKRILKRIAEGKEGAKLYDWWNIEQIKNVSKIKTGHPCQIPEEIIKRIILTTAQENQTIIDPFAGSGTTLAVAKKLGFRAVGYEIDPLYFDIMTKRILTLELF